MKIINNFLEKENFEKLRNIIMSSEFPWSYNEYCVDPPAPQISQFTHAFFWNSIPRESYLVVKPLVEKHKVKMMGHEDNKQKMYDRLTKVFHSSASETFNFVKAECLLTKTLYDGLDSAESGCELGTKTEILDAWKKLLNLS